MSTQEENKNTLSEASKQLSLQLKSKLPEPPQQNITEKIIEETKTPPQKTQSIFSLKANSGWIVSLFEAGIIIGLITWFWR